MHTYNRIMLYFWLIAAISILVFITYMSFTDGIKKWGYYYIFSLIALVMFFLRRIMMRRMDKHLAFLEEQKNKKD
jgi:bacteriorhodopsin